ncbi:hypothetical protein Rrhod_1362 [Rhodococcus rhodnii LMG 5362]|uniref:Uncharacterized protein n=1 Tax=Rhodococcus rhodnii LMG 5362 TaxID=1273125 RepID=R7WPP0_9NOCA|nr:hypothetical protein Rrhod_1362 [Rhodococcus rhodnii LMG 5362]
MRIGSPSLSLRPVSTTVRTPISWSRESVAITLPSSGSIFAMRLRTNVYSPERFTSGSSRYSAAAAGRYCMSGSRYMTSPSWNSK